MPYCKNCHQEITRFDSDICPYCGTPHPIAEGYETMDVTRGFGSLQGHYELPKAKKKKTAVILTATLGIFGVHHFYMGFKIRGIIAILITILAVAGVGSIFLLLPLPPYLGYVIMLGCIILFHLVEAFALAKTDSPKDGKGDFLR